MYFEGKFFWRALINSVSVILILLQSGKVSFVQHFLSFQGTHEIKFMFRKINISKKKQFYQEIPIENMRYLNKKRKSQLSSNKSTWSSNCILEQEDILEWHNLVLGLVLRDGWVNARSKQSNKAARNGDNTNIPRSFFTELEQASANKCTIMLI